jgi:hypothetical protein
MDDNVIKFPGAEEIDFEALETALVEEDKVKVEQAIQAALERNFDDVIIIGTYDDKDNTYFATTSGDPAKIIWDLERSKFLLMNSFVGFAENPYDE